MRTSARTPAGWPPQLLRAHLASSRHAEQSGGGQHGKQEGRAQLQAGHEGGEAAQHRRHAQQRVAQVQVQPLAHASLETTCIR